MILRIASPISTLWTTILQRMFTIKKKHRSGLALQKNIATPNYLQMLDVLPSSGEKRRTLRKQ